MYIDKLGRGKTDKSEKMSILMNQYTANKCLCKRDIKQLQFAKFYLANSFEKMSRKPGMLEQPNH